jgi:hypothetical protein
VREQVTYPVIERLQQRYRGNGGIKIVVQTTGDLLTEAIVDDLLQRGVYMISIASIDEYHVGIETAAKQEAFIERLSKLFEAAGVRRSGLSATTRNWHEEEGPLYSFFGAAPDTWIGKIWPRGRAWNNDLSTATIADNFCNRWSGGLGFLNHGYSGSEVSIEPDGAVYPCCVKTKLPIGNLLDEPLIEILDSLAGEPAYEAINAGHPERMGIAHGWSLETFLAKSRTLTPAGKSYQNACIGCDRFHQEVLGDVIERAGCGGATRASLRRARRRMSGMRARRGACAAGSNALRALGCAALCLRRTGATAAPETRSWDAITAARAARPSTGTPGPATSAPTPSSPGSATKSRSATASPSSRST